MSERKVIYIADDDVNICNIIKLFLTKEGYIVKTFFDGPSILKAFEKNRPDMLVIDIMMPEIDGFAVCSEVRKLSGVPIIIVSAKDTEHDKIVGFDLGIDDYLTKPFSPRELIARIKSIFRRVEQERTNKMDPEEIRLFDLVIKPDIMEVQCGGKNVGLTGMEFSLVYYLAQNKNKAIGRSELLDKVWRFESTVETRATDDMIKRIRKKLSDCGSALNIKTVWGFGYKIEEKD